MKPIPTLIKRTLLVGLALSVVALPSALSARQPQASFAAQPQVWLSLGPGMQYYNWIYVQSGIAAKTNTALYRSTYESSLAESGAFFAAQMTSAKMRDDAVRRLNKSLKELREHDPDVFNSVMEANGLAMVD